MMPLICVERFGRRNNLRVIGVKRAMKRLVGTLGVLAFFAIGAVGAVRMWNLAGSAYDAVTFPSHVAAGLAPRLRSSDAYRITLDYLSAQTPKLAAPELHHAAALKSIWAVSADQAAALDGCIPTGKGSGIVWVTKGAGDYLNLATHPWSSPDGSAPAACRDAAAAGTIVIDDSTGAILGVYPDSGPSDPHPSPQVTLAPASALPILQSPSPNPSSSPSAGASSGPSASGSARPSPAGSSKPGASPTPRPTATGG